MSEEVEILQALRMEGRVRLHIVHASVVFFNLQCLFCQCAAVIRLCLTLAVVKKHGS